MASIKHITRELSQNPQAVQKRNYRTLQREKRRRSFFIHDYVRTKHPDIFNQANEMYQYFMDKYPTRADFTKLYYLKKWQKKMDESRSHLFLPHRHLQTLYNEQQRATNNHSANKNPASNHPANNNAANNNPASKHPANKNPSWKNA